MADSALVVDKAGLARKLAHKPKAFVIYELLQNGWDEPGVTEVSVEAEMEPGKQVCRIFVCDDAPLGFQDLTSVYTMFKDSKKAPDPTKRGFLDNRVPVFGGHIFSDFADKLRMTGPSFRWNVNDLPTRAQVLQWYLELNTGGVVHTSAEIKRVQALLARERG